MVERFVAVDQFFELLDDLQLGPVIGFFLLVQTGHVLVPLAAVLGEQLFEALFGRVRPFFVSGFSARRRILGRLFFIGDLGGCRGGLRHIFNAGGIDLFHGNRRIFLVGVHRFAVYC